MHYQEIETFTNSIDLSGETFGRLTAIAPVDRTKSGMIRWLCICECGTEHVVAAKILRGGLQKSCGCYRQEVTGARSKSHGQSNNPTYNAWKNMVARCTKPGRAGYDDYGGRGISVCDRWLTFQNFFEDTGVKPKGKTLDRIDNSGDYTPENCRWATVKQQARNKRNNRLIEIDGETKCLAEWLELTGVHEATFRSRIRRGLSEEKALIKQRYTRG